MTSLANRAKDKDVGLGADAFNAQKANKDAEQEGQREQMEQGV